MFRNTSTWLALGFMITTWSCGDGGGLVPPGEEDGSGGSEALGGDGSGGGGKAQGSGGNVGGHSTTSGAGSAGSGSGRAGAGGGSGGRAGAGGSSAKVDSGGTGGGRAGAAGRVDDPGGAGSGGRAGGGGGPAGNSGGSSAAGGGSAGSSGSASGGSAGGSANGSACSPVFASGLNVAWLPNKYAVDIPNPDLVQFGQLFKDSVGSGGHIIRWWFHTNGTTTPSWDSGGLAARVSDAVIADVKSLADTAYKDGAALVVSLWSHNMLMRNQMTAQILANNKALLQKDANRQAYIDNVLTPLVTALKGHPGIYAWEAFNEPEGMINDGPNTTPWTVDKSKPETANDYVSIKDIQKTVNWFGAAVHTADPNALFTNGAWTLLANTDVDEHTNYYSDERLAAVGGKANGTLDFYEVHYYDNWGTPGAADVISPLVHPASYWKLDKRLMVGEFWAVNTGSVKADDIYTKLYDTGYSGAWAWQYANLDNPGPSTSTKWPAMKPGMDKLYTAHKADLDCR